jgi:hypothetical protein
MTADRPETGARPAPDARRAAHEVAPARADRLKAALKANLARRKARARARISEGVSAQDECGGGHD